jgi:hypothetical protein
MAQIARTGADKATDTTRNATNNIAELRKRTADQASDSAPKAVERTEAMAQTVQRTAGALEKAQSQVAHQAAEGTTKLSRGFVDLMNEQTRHNLATLKALTGTVAWDRVTKAVDWDQVFQIQGEYLRASLERATQFTQRYFEVVQAVTSAAADAARRQAKKAA